MKNINIDDRFYYTLKCERFCGSFVIRFVLYDKVVNKGVHADSMMKTFYINRYDSYEKAIQRFYDKSERKFLKKVNKIINFIYLTDPYIEEPVESKSEENKEDVWAKFQSKVGKSPMQQIDWIIENGLDKFNEWHRLYFVKKEEM